MSRPGAWLAAMALGCGGCPTIAEECPPGVRLVPVVGPIDCDDPCTADFGDVEVGLSSTLRIAAESADEECRAFGFPELTEDGGAFSQLPSTDGRLFSFVQFTPPTDGVFEGALVFQSDLSTPVTVALAGEGVLP